MLCALFIIIIWTKSNIKWFIFSSSWISFHFSVVRKNWNKCAMCMRTLAFCGTNLNVEWKRFKSMLINKMVSYSIGYYYYCILYEIHQHHHFIKTVRVNWLLSLCRIPFLPFACFNCLFLKFNLRVARVNSN